MFLREIDRVYGIIYDSFMIDKYNDFISSKTTNNVIIQNMLDLYAALDDPDFDPSYGNMGQKKKVPIKKDPNGSLSFL